MEKDRSVFEKLEQGGLRGDDLQKGLTGADRNQRGAKGAGDLNIEDIAPITGPVGSVNPKAETSTGDANTPTGATSGPGEPAGQGDQSE